MATGEIQKGDSVYHVSNKSLTLGVDWVKDSNAGCSWIDSKGCPQAEKYHVNTLVKIIKDEKDDSSDAGGVYIA